MTITPAYIYARQFRKNCQRVGMTNDDEIELARLFSVAQTEAANHGREMVIEKIKSLDTK